MCTLFYDPTCILLPHSSSSSSSSSSFSYTSTSCIGRSSPFCLRRNWLRHLWFNYTPWEEEEEEEEEPWWRPLSVIQVEGTRRDVTAAAVATHYPMISTLLLSIGDLIVCLRATIYCVVRQSPIRDEYKRSSPITTDRLMCTALYRFTLDQRPI
jgi:hypothetical protein